MNQHYNQNYTLEEIKEVLDKIHKCIASGKYTISLNDKRKENINFMLNCLTLTGKLRLLTFIPNLI